MRDIIRKATKHQGNKLTYVIRQKEKGEKVRNHVQV